MNAILFLDFDGVLHPIVGEPVEGTFCRLPMLEALLREPGLAHVGVVVSSTWREVHALPQLRSHFSADLRARVIDGTPVLDDHAGPHRRWREIRAWLERHPLVERHVTLDDQETWFPASWHEHAVFTDPATGLTVRDLARVRERLAPGGA